MSREQQFPSRHEIMNVTRDWMQEKAPGKKDVDGYSEDDLVNIAVASISSYMNMINISKRLTEASEEEFKKALLPVLKESKNLRLKRSSHKKRDIDKV